jgi:mono/diheme cytochrome c family protein
LRHAGPVPHFSPAMNDTKRRNKTLPILLLAVAAVLIAFAVYHVLRDGSWNLPADAKSLKNPLTPTAANLAAAKKTYEQKCVNCHGDEGKGDGSDAMMYDPAPSDLTNGTKMNKRTDGQIFYQITEGKKPMPSYRNKLSDEQRWQLVLLVRSFAAQPAGGGSSTSSGHN